jgi:carboxyl-terminal processing protease
MPRAFACRRALRIASCAALVALAPLVARAAAPVREPCAPEATGIDAASKTGVRIGLGPAHPTGVANWDIHRWQRHRVWITLTAANDGDTPAALLPQVLLDARPDGGAAARLTGRLVVVAPHATGSERLSVWVPEDAKTLSVHIGEGGGATVSVSFVHECSSARFDAGVMAVPAAVLLKEAMDLYLEVHADPVANPREAADTALHLASGAQDGADVAWALRGMMQSLRDEHGFVVGPGEPLPAPLPQAAREPSFEWLPEGIAVVHLHGGDALSADAALALAAAVHDGISERAARRPRGWIVDLRGNGGDSPWPSLAGLSSLLGGPLVGASVAQSGREAWIVDRGAARIAGGPVRVDLQSPPEPSFEGPVAVLLDRNTSNEGELVAVAFQGRPRTRFFGVPTAGCPSWCVRTRPLRDGTILGLVEVRPAARDGRVQREPITPDVLLDGTAPLGGVPREAVEWVLDERLSAGGNR